MKKPLQINWSGFFAVVDRRSELSNFIHNDLAALSDHLEEEGGRVFLIAGTNSL